MSLIKKIVKTFIPPPEWQLPVIILLGIFFGLGFYTMRVSNAVSYLSKDPQACINCHVMVPQYATWKRSSHKSVSCVDCHVPHDNIFRTYYFKMKDGTRHATIFTMHAEPQVIRIKSEGAAVVQENCLHCHQHVLQDVSAHKITYEDYKQGKGKLCWECHREVPHGRTLSLSATPYTRVPESETIVPEWLKEFVPITKRGQTPLSP